MLGMTLLERVRLKTCIRGSAIKSAASLRKWGSSMSEPADLLGSSCFKALWTSITSRGVRLNDRAIELIGGGKEWALCSLGCFGSGCKDSNKEPDETKCSLKQFRIADLSVIVHESFTMQAGSSFVVIFPYEDFITFQNFLGSLRLLVVLER